MEDSASSEGVHRPDLIKLIQLIDENLCLGDRLSVRSLANSAFQRAGLVRTANQPPNPTYPHNQKR
jgi:hypothetical protein